MLANSVVIVLREVLEAALLIGLLSGFSRREKLSSMWLVYGAVIGFIFAVLYAFFINEITDWFNGVGQEVLNALLLLMVYGFLLLICILMARSKKDFIRSGVTPLMCCVIALILAHEGAEMILYWSGTFYNLQLASSVLMGSMIGMGIGFSVGFLFYVLIIIRLADASYVYLHLLLSLVAAGLCLQATQFLVQADWISSASAIWDTSSLLSEESLLGQLSYALFGYEATPSLLQILVYAISLIIFLALPLYMGRPHEK